MTDKKYELLKEETLKYRGKTLYRIRALKDFNDVKAGDRGGWIESEDNLSQKYTCWVYDNSKVFDEATIKECSVVRGEVSIGGVSILTEYSEIRGRVEVLGSVNLAHYATINCSGKIRGKVYMLNHSHITGYIEVDGKITMTGTSNIEGIVYVRGNLAMDNASSIKGEGVTIHSIVDLKHTASIQGSITIRDNAIFKGNVVITSNDQFLVFKNTWSSGRHFTYTHSNKMWSVGCFYGTGKQLIEKAYKDSKKSGDNYKAYVKLVEHLYSDKSSLWGKIKHFFIT